jgi:hypothetical protein
MMTVDVYVNGTTYKDKEGEEQWLDQDFQVYISGTLDRDKAEALRDHIKQSVTEWLEAQGKENKQEET